MEVTMWNTSKAKVAVKKVLHPNPRWEAYIDIDDGENSITLFFRNIGHLLMFAESIGAQTEKLLNYKEE